MGSPSQPFTRTVALKSLEWAVRFWPTESRQWGQAVLAETHEIASPGEALHWAIGGMALFFRSHLAHLLSLLKLAPGRTDAHLPLPSGSNGPQFPRHSRLVTAIVLLAVALLLVLPSGREATHVVTSSWRNFGESASDSRTVEKLAARAEKQNDARALAFAAICHPDADRASQLADKAVSLDPNLVWIYASRFRRPQDTPADKNWMNRLRDSDAGNAFVYFLSAEAAAGPQANGWIMKMGSPDANAAEAALRDSGWARLMDRAFTAPRYDSYLRAHLDLTREGWRKAPEMPASLVAYSVWSHQIPDMTQIRAYVDIRIEEARTAASTGRDQLAEETLQQTVALGERMTAGSETDIERLVAMLVTRRGLEGLRDFYAEYGRKEEAASAALRISKLEEMRDRLVHNYPQKYSETAAHFRRTAVWVQASAGLAVSLIAMTALSLLWLELGAVFSWGMGGKLRRFACRITDYGPVSMLLMSAIFLLSFRPFAAALRRYRDAGSSEATELFNSQLWALADRNPFAFLFDPASQWTLWLFFIIALVVSAVMVILRGLLRARAAHTPAR